MYLTDQVPTTAGYCRSLEIIWIDTERMSDTRAWPYTLPNQ